MAERTPDERERARLEREARRAARAGRFGRSGRRAPAAAEPPVLPPAPIRGPEQDGSGERAPAGQDGSGQRGPAGQAGAPPPPAPPPATGREWRRAVGEPDPEPPNVRRVSAPQRREEVHPHREPLPEAPRSTPAPERRIPPPPGGREEPLGTRRVSAGHRLGRPHLPGRPAAGRPAAPGGAGRTARRAGALLALAAVALVLWFGASLFQPFAGRGGPDVVVEIPKGATVGEVGDLLEAKGVISSSFFFGLRARLEGKDSALNSGRIRMADGMSYAAALDALTRPAKAPPRLTRLTLPEGLSRTEMAETIKDAGIPGDYVAATRRSPLLDPRRYGAPRGATLEGFLFPATYQLRPNATVRDLVAQQVKAFRRAIAHVDLRRARRRNLTTYDVLVIASMIEREAGIPRDRPLIAAVIYNRLKAGMPLGIDATLRYELGNWTRPLKVSELQADTPYNTRTNSGLPPSPIGNPGLAAIRAAARPANVDYLYYVVKPCGNGASSFSTTDAQFQRDVAAYDAKRAQLGGKSPVTCK